jgi:hypothetical protein
MSPSILFRMKNVSEKLETYVLRSKAFFENRAVYGIMRKNIVERGRPQSTWCMMDT